MIWIVSPGVMLASAGRTFLNQYGVAIGQRVGVYTANDSAYAAAFDLKQSGIDVPAIVDLRKSVDDKLLLKANSPAGVMLRLLYRTVIHFVEHLRVITLVSDSLEQKLAGAEARCYVPSRFEEGYGPSAPALERPPPDGAQIALSVHRGVTALAEVVTV